MSVEIDAASKERPEIVMTHFLDAPRELVWTAFTTARHVARWYGGKGFINTIEEHDLRPGGHWRQVMRTAEGEDRRLHFVFVEVVKPERLSWQTMERGVHGDDQLTALNILTLADLGQRTKVTYVARFQTLAARDLAAGWGFAKVLSEGVEKMNALIASLV